MSRTSASFADVKAAHGSLDVHVLFFALAVFLYVDVAGRQGEEYAEYHDECEP